MAREALAFDMYATLVNPMRIWQELERYIPQNGIRVAELWRHKQLEYTFRLTAMERYEDFEQVTSKALDYALAAFGYTLKREQKQLVMGQYNDLECFPDVEPALERLKAAGYTMVVFSNGSPSMLSPLMKAADLEKYFHGFVSVDEIRAYKPSPKVYQLVATKLGRPIGEVRLNSSNPFDVIGAMNAGMQAAWIDRSGGLFDTLGSRPEMVVRTLTELADRLV